MIRVTAAWEDHLAVVTATEEEFARLDLAARSNDKAAARRLESVRERLAEETATLAELSKQRATQDRILRVVEATIEKRAQEKEEARQRRDEDRAALRLARERERVETRVAAAIEKQQRTLAERRARTRGLQAGEDPAIAVQRHRAETATAALEADIRERGAQTGARDPRRAQLESTNELQVSLLAHMEEEKRIRDAIAATRQEEIDAARELRDITREVERDLADAERRRKAEQRERLKKDLAAARAEFEVANEKFLEEERRRDAARGIGESAASSFVSALSTAVASNDLDGILNSLEIRFREMFLDALLFATIQAPLENALGGFTGSIFGFFNKPSGPAPTPPTTESVQNPFGDGIAASVERGKSGDLPPPIAVYADMSGQADEWAKQMGPTGATLVVAQANRARGVPARRRR